MIDPSRFSLLLAFVLPAIVNAASCFTRLASDNFTNCIELHNGTIALHWTISSDQASVLFGVDSDVSSKSWLGVGISSSGAMKGADLWITHATGNSSFEIKDTFATDYARPILDASQDLTLITLPDATANNNTLVYTFRRPLITADSQDLPILKGIKHEMVWAYGSLSPDTFQIQQHAPNTRGSFELVLYKNPLSPAIVQPDDLSTFVVQMPNYTVPAQRTTYTCFRFNAPGGDYHITKYESLIMTKFAHHMIVFGCENPPPTNDPYDCPSMDTNCKEMILGQPGSVNRTYEYPPEAGVRIGDQGPGTKYMTIQIHYNNVDNIAGVVDTSGFKMHITKKIRKYDVGVLITGDFDISIPANKELPTVLQPNVCSSLCTKQFPTNLTVFGSLAHMHELGMSQTVAHYRNGVEISPLLQADYFDFGFQRFAPAGAYGRGDVIIPGDELVTTCRFLPTVGRSYNTFYGLSSDMEMCMNFVLYYPKMYNIQVCMQMAGYDVCDPSTKTPAMHTYDDVPKYIDAPPIIASTTLFILPGLLGYHFFAQYIYKRVLERGYEKPIKFTMHLLYLVPEIVSFVLLCRFYLYPVISSMVKDSYFMEFTPTQAWIYSIVSLYFISAYSYEIYFDKEINMMLLVHHIVAVLVTSAGYLLALNTSDVLVKEFILISGFNLANHLAIDFIPHIYLIARRGQNVNKGLLKMLSHLCIWPVTIFRLLGNVLFVFIVRYFARKCRLNAQFYAWTAVMSVAVVILAVTQVWAHGIYVAIAKKDGELKRRKSGIELRESIERKSLTSSR
ncbi:PHM/PNGase F domain-containing protein [Obelidium mucronatum]|nr:PHM/PNGase F domain-containing protein [Obelidium mucronatum]